MRALFSFSFAINGTVFDLKALPMCDESAVEVKRVTAYKDPATGHVTANRPKAPAEKAEIAHVAVSTHTGAVLDSSQMVKGIWRGEQFIEISDDDLAALRLSNGEFRVLGTVDTDEPTLKGTTMNVVPAKGTKEARARFTSLAKTVEAYSLFIEGSVRGKQRLYMLTAYNGAMALDEVAYEDEIEHFEYPEEIPKMDLAAAEEIDLTSVPALDEVPHSSFIAAFNEKYGASNA